MKKLIVGALCASLAVVATAGFSGSAFALSKGFCDDYATQKANKKANFRVVEGLALGVLSGLVIGSIAGGKNSATKGAIIGGVGGTALGGISAQDKWKKTYRYQYKLCRQAPSKSWLYDNN